MPNHLPLVFDAPARGKAPKHWLDFDVPERRAAMESFGLPAFRADQISRHVFDSLSDEVDLDGSARGDPGGPGRAALPAPAHPGAPADRRPGAHRQDLVAAARRLPPGIRANALPEPLHPVHQLPGGLRNGVSLLRHRSGRAETQPVAGRDNRPGLRGEPDAGRRRGSVGHRPAQQHRFHGDGGAAGQLQGGAGNHPHPDRSRARGIRDERPGNHRVHRRPGAADRAPREEGFP